MSAPAQIVLNLIEDFEASGKEVPNIVSRRNGKRKALTWRRIDLHLHTPASMDYREPGVSYLQILQKAEEKGLDVIAFTDHNTVAGYASMLREIERLGWLEETGRLNDAEKATLSEYRRLRSKILVLPGFELTATLGFHVIGVFSEKTPVRRLEHVLLDLRVPDAALEVGSGEVGATTDVITAYRTIAEAGGLVIAAHANSTHGVALMDFNFGGQTKISMTQDPHLHALEVTDFDSPRRRNTAWFFSGSKPEYPRRMHCIQGSDAHRLSRDPVEKQYLGVGDRATEVLLEEVSFDSLKNLFLSDDFTHTRPYRPMAQAPFDFVKAARKEGPNIVQSFHESFPARPAKRLEVLKDIIAFANTNGGTIYLGVNPNARVPVRGVERADEAVELLRTEVQKSIAPPIELNIEVKNSEGKSVLVVGVPAGKETPYTLGTGQIYVRQENETSLAMRDEIVRLVKKSLDAELPSEVPSLPSPEEHIPNVEPEPTAEVSPSLAVEPPKTGAEIVEAIERDGARYYSIKDLRNGSVVRNVTRFSARHLWHYAITEREDHPVREEEVTWKGEIGLWKTYKRSGVRRYNLVQQDADGALHVYYGVTEEGIHGPWRAFVPEEKA